MQCPKRSATALRFDGRVVGLLELDRWNVTEDAVRVPGVVPMAAAGGHELGAPNCPARSARTIPRQAPTLSATAVDALVYDRYPPRWLSTSRTTLVRTSGSIFLCDCSSFHPKKMRHRAWGATTRERHRMLSDRHANSLSLSQMHNKDAATTCLTSKLVLKIPHNCIAHRTQTKSKIGYHRG